MHTKYQEVFQNKDVTMNTILGNKPTGHTMRKAELELQGVLEPFSYLDHVRQDWSVFLTPCLWLLLASVLAVTSLHEHIIIVKNMPQNRMKL